MKIEGNLEKSKSSWAASVPLVLVYTQGKNKKDALFMVKDAIESLIDDKKFKVTVSLCLDVSKFTVQSNNESKLMAFALRQQRLHQGLSIRDVVKRMGLKSPTSYSRYESGKIKPGFNQISRLFKAVNANLELILKTA